MCKLRKPYVLRMSKTALREAFGKLEGIQLTPRRVGIFVSSVNADERSFELPQCVVQQLKLTPGCYACITRQRETGECVLKRLDIQSGETGVPGSVTEEFNRLKPIGSACSSRLRRHKCGRGGPRR